jgi:2-methylcitrate dehydratase
MERIQVVADPWLSKQYPAAMPNLIEITLTNGQKYAKQVDYPKGHPKNAMTDAEVEAKFAGLCRGFLGPKRVQKTLDRLWELEKIKDAATIPSLFSSVQRRSA